MILSPTAEVRFASSERNNRPNFGLHADKVTYQVQFATAGTYYLYMRFTMFDNAGGNISLPPAYHGKE